MSAATKFGAGRGELPSPGLRQQIATAVHEVIVRDRGAMTGLCQLYAIVGAMVAMALTKVEYIVQYGSLYIDLEDGREERVFAFHSSDGGLARGEFHCWFGAPHRDGRIELVDFASHLYPQYVRTLLPGAVCPPLPPFIWGWGDALPKNVSLVPDQQVWLDATADRTRYEAQCATAAVLAREALQSIDYARSRPVERQHPKIGRNAPCPCGSDKKFKKCCGSGDGEVVGVP